MKKTKENEIPKKEFNEQRKLFVGCYLKETDNLVEKQKLLEWADLDKKHMLVFRNWIRENYACKSEKEISKEIKTWYMQLERKNNPKFDNMSSIIEKKWSYYNLVILYEI